MGKMIWNHWGRLVALVSGAWTLWGGLWGIFYRKFPWDFMGGGQLGPVGIIPPPSAAIFVENVHKLPVVQVICVVNGLLTLIIEWPVFPGSFVYRSLALKTLLYIQAAVFSALVYQTLDAAVFYVIAVLAYSRGIVNGEVVEGKTGERDDGRV